MMSRALVFVFACIAITNAQLAPHVPGKASPWTWDNCGTKLDRLETDKVSVSGKFIADNKLSVTASGTTNLHVPLDTGAWQIRVYETGMPKSVGTNVGDLMKALKFTDAKNTTFSLTIEFDMPKKQASGEFNANLVATDQAKSDYLCLDVKYKLAAMEELVTLTAPAPPAPKPSPLCFHEEDKEDHKCFEACNAEGKKFATKGIEGAGNCPTSYNTVDTTKTVLQCPDGVTNVRYCAASALNVTIATKGEAGVAMLAAAFQAKAVQDFSVYCMNDPSKQAPFYCHAPPLPVSCKTDKDCVTPWYSSFCMNDATKKAPFVCKIELPPKCKTDKDCERK